MAQSCHHRTCTASQSELHVCVKQKISCARHCRYFGGVDLTLRHCHVCALDHCRPVYACRVCQRGVCDIHRNLAYCVRCVRTCSSCSKHTGVDQCSTCRLCGQGWVCQHCQLVDDDTGAPSGVHAECWRRVRMASQAQPDATESWTPHPIYAHRSVLRKCGQRHCSETELHCCDSAPRGGWSCLEHCHRASHWGVRPCHVCQAATCESRPCLSCGQFMCDPHTVECDCCSQKNLCERCALVCSRCYATVAADHRVPCGLCGQGHLCPACRDKRPNRRDNGEGPPNVHAACWQQAIAHCQRASPNVTEPGPDPPVLHH